MIPSFDGAHSKLLFGKDDKNLSVLWLLTIMELCQPHILRYSVIKATGTAEKIEWSGAKHETSTTKVVYSLALEGAL